MLVHEANMQNTFGAVFAFARLNDVVLLFVEMGLKVSEKECALDVADFFVKREDEALETIGTEMMQGVGVFLFECQI